MRFKLYFDLENEAISIQYRKNILSYIKKSLSEYNEDDYKRFYNERDNIVKPFTFSVFLKNSQFDGDTILVHSKSLELNLSTSDYSAGIALYNSFNHQKNKKFNLNCNSMTLRNIVLLPDKEIKEKQVMIKFLSPLVVRDRKERKDYYYSYENEKFLDTLKLNIKIQLKNLDLPESMAEGFDIKPVNAKKVIVKFYEKKIETSVGTFILSGNPELLNFLYLSGIGSRHSAGFGMFDIV